VRLFVSLTPETSENAFAPGGLILGFDPGLSITGYGIIRVKNQQPELVEAGILKMRRDRTLAERLKELHDGVVEILGSFPIAAVAIEQLYSHYERPRTAILMGHARGVLCLAAANANLAVHSYEKGQAHVDGQRSST